jgi:hypothetical protein
MQIAVSREAGDDVSLKITILISYLAENVHRSYREQDMQSTYNVTLSRLRLTTVEVEKQ